MTKIKRKLSLKWGFKPLLKIKYQLKIAGTTIKISLILLPIAIDNETGFDKPTKLPIITKASSCTPIAAGIKKAKALIIPVKDSIKRIPTNETSISIILRLQSFKQKTSSKLLSVYEALAGAFVFRKYEVLDLKTSQF